MLIVQNDFCQASLSLQADDVTRAAASSSATAAAQTEDITLPGAPHCGPCLSQARKDTRCLDYTSQGYMI